MKLIYGGAWAQENGKGMYNYQRSLSTVVDAVGVVPAPIEAVAKWRSPHSTRWPSCLSLPE